MDGQPEGSNEVIVLIVGYVGVECATFFVIMDSA